MNLPKKLEEKCVNNSAKYVDFDILYHEKHNKGKSGAKEASIYREGFKNACELLLPEIEKLQNGLKLIVDLGKGFDDEGNETMSIQGNEAEELLKQWQEFTEG